LRLERRYEVVTARDGTKVGAGAERQPDVAIFDVSMPGLTGSTSLVSREAGTAAVILLTARAPTPM
jgi:DNA-binding response OmpR family regulator